jgi:hypothetical protein
MTHEKNSQGRGSAVGMLTCYGVDGPVIEPRWGRCYAHLFRLTLGLTQPPAQ